MEINQCKLFDEFLWRNIRIFSVFHANEFEYFKHSVYLLRCTRNYLIIETRDSRLLLEWINTVHPRYPTRYSLYYIFVISSTITRITYWVYINVAYCLRLSLRHMMKSTHVARNRTSTRPMIRWSNIKAKKNSVAAAVICSARRKKIK